MSRFHVVDPYCGVAGGEDFGAVDTHEEAERIIAARVATGDEGGCRCHRGYLIQTCEERVRVDLGWTERQAADIRLFSTGLMNLRSYGPKSGVTRTLTPEEIASHKCYNYQPKRFHDILDDFYEKQYNPLDKT
jgi:hypothetical protein